MTNLDILSLEVSNKFECLEHNKGEKIDKLNDKVHDIFGKVSEEKSWVSE